MLYRDLINTPQVLTKMEVPKEVKKYLDAFKSTLSDVEEVFEPVFSVSLADIYGKIEDLEKAKLHLVFAYSINSLFWMYLCTQGVDPRNHPIKQELIRIQRYMARVKEIADKKKAPRVDVAASKRFVRNALWEDKKEQDQPETSKRKASDEHSKQSPAKKSR